MCLLRNLKLHFFSTSTEICHASILIGIKPIVRTYIYGRYCCVLFLNGILYNSKIFMKLFYLSEIIKAGGIIRHGKESYISTTFK